MKIASIASALDRLPVARLASSGLRLLLLRKRVPVMAIVMLTNRCNGKCVYCDIPHRPKDELSTDRVLAMLDEMAEAGVCRLGLLGGEPLLRDDILEIVSHARKRKFMVQLYSNGYLVPQHLDAIRQLDSLIISLDGPGELHDAARGKGSHAKVLRAIDAARAHVPVFLLSVLSRKNVSAIPYLCAIAKEKECHISFQTVTGSTEAFAADVSDLLLSEEETKRIYREIYERKKTNEWIVTSKSFVDLIQGADFSMARPQHQLGVVKCWYGRAIAHVDSNGDVNSCSVMIGKEPSLNLTRHSFGEAWAHLAGNVCPGCNMTCGVEYNMLFSLKVRAMLNALSFLVPSKRT